MSNDETILIVHKGAEIVLKNETFHDCLNHKRSRYIHRDVGELKHVSFQSRDHKIWLSRYSLFTNATIHLKNNGDCISIVFILGDSIPYNVEGIGPGIASRETYNIVSLPKIDVQYNLAANAEYFQFGIEFEKDFLASIRTQASGELPYSLTGAPYLSRREGYPILESMKETIKAVSGELEHEKMDLTLHMNSLILSLADEAFKATQYAIQSDELEFKSIEAYTKSHLDTVTVKYLCFLFEKSPIELRRLMIKFANTDTSHFIIKCQMEKANELLIKTDMQIKHVSKAVGYASSSSFANAFRKFFGEWPMNIRNNSCSRS